MVVAELTSYLRCGFLQILSRTKKLKTVFDKIPTNGCTVSGKKLQIQKYAECKGRLMLNAVFLRKAQAKLSRGIKLVSINGIS